jgi:hypothetical protein
MSEVRTGYTMFSEMTQNRATPRGVKTLECGRIEQPEVATF